MRVEVGDSLSEACSLLLSMASAAGRTHPQRPTGLPALWGLRYNTLTGWENALVRKRCGLLPRSAQSPASFSVNLGEEGEWLKFR